MSMSLDDFCEDYFRSHPDRVKSLPNQPLPFPNGRCQHCGFPIDDHGPKGCPK